MSCTSAPRDSPPAGMFSVAVLVPGSVVSKVSGGRPGIADGIETYARLVGRENVLAGADCGFSSRATFKPEIHPTIVWAKFEALAAGARLATTRLWLS